MPCSLNGDCRSGCCARYVSTSVRPNFSFSGRCPAGTKSSRLRRQLARLPPAIAFAMNFGLHPTTSDATADSSRCSTLPAALIDRTEGLNGATDAYGVWCGCSTILTVGHHSFTEKADLVRASGIRYDGRLSLKMQNCPPLHKLYVCESPMLHFGERRCDSTSHQ